MLTTSRLRLEPAGADHVDLMVELNADREVMSFIRAFAAPEIDRLVASTMAVNVASRRVLEKVGMILVDNFVRDWHEPIEGSEQGEVVYELRRAR